MGYYVSTVESTARIHKDNLDKAYQLLCELNSHDELKHGGTNMSIEDICKREDIDLAKSKSTSKSPNKWFSWMPWNYDEVYPDAQTILERCGFDYMNFDGEYLTIDGYDNKAGCETEFLKALAPVIESETYIIWRGEGGEIFADLFENGNYAQVEMTYSIPQSEATKQPEFAKTMLKLIEQ